MYGINKVLIRKDSEFESIDSERIFLMLKLREKISSKYEFYENYSFFSIKQILNKENDKINKEAKEVT